MNRAGRDKRQELPEELRIRCSSMAQEIREQNLYIRDERIMTARMRMCSGYYDSDHVLSIIASRLLLEGNLD